MTTVPSYVNNDLLVETQWLAERLQRRDIRIVDMGTYDAYLRAHIPGALHVGLGEKSYQIKDPADPQYIMPPEQFDALMSSMGIGNESLVIAYDSDGGHTAGRLWWVMSYYGRPNCKLLNGGWNKWLAEKRPVSIEIPHYPKTAFVSVERPKLIAYVDDVEKAIGNNDSAIMDVRSDAEWLGTESLGNARTGHIPGAAHAEWSNFVSFDAHGVFKSQTEMQELLWKAGITPNKKVIVYCQAGIRASQSAFVLKLLGYDEVAVYDGSFSEWGNLDDTPIEKDGKITKGAPPAAKKKPTAKKPVVKKKAAKAKAPAKKAVKAKVAKAKKKPKK